MSNGTPKRVMGNGEGFTTLILTDADSRLIRVALEANIRAEMEKPVDTGVSPVDAADALMRPLEAYYRGIQRATDRIKAEFDAEQKARKK